MDPFFVLGIARTFDIDPKDLERRHRELSKALHPDKFSGAGMSERNYALSKAIEVNDAWRVLRDPIRRAEALFSLSGIPIGETNEPKAAPSFLMEILDYREELAVAKINRDSKAIQRLDIEMKRRFDEIQRVLSNGFQAAFERPEDIPQTLRSLVPKLGEMRFYQRFIDEIHEYEDGHT